VAIAFQRGSLSRSKEKEVSLLILIMYNGSKNCKFFGCPTSLKFEEK
jgi:hypothetical protein